MADLTFVRVSNTIVTTVNSTGRTVTIENEYLGNDGVQTIQFADGTAWSVSDIRATEHDVGDAANIEHLSYKARTVVISIPAVVDR